MTPTTTTAIPTMRPRARRARIRSWRQLALTLPADAPELLGPIRRLVLAHAIDWGAKPSTAQDLEVCVSELLSNALRYSDGPARLELRVHHGAAHLSVSDTSTDAPAEPGADVTGAREHGRGLHLVRALSDAISIRRYPWGKTVAVSFDLT